ncbi:MAG: hypothetical protein MO846_08955 [Candidatus Devosia symbiotica]|nr:hypothetical protein [Candidatus Devosia symbiotica]
MSLPESTPEAIVPAQISAPASPSIHDGRNGALAALAAYVLWGFLPLLFWQVEAAGSVMIVAERTVWSLLLFAFAVRRLRLTTIGMFQYLALSIQFLVAIYLFGETLNGLRLAGFALIWLSLMLFSYDSFARRKRPVVAPAA